MADDHETRIASLEAKVKELEALVNISLRLSAADKPLCALLARFGATEAETLAVHALLLETLKLDRPAYQQLHTFVTAQGWPDWR